MGDLYIISIIFQEAYYQVSMHRRHVLKANTVIIPLHLPEYCHFLPDLQTALKRDELTIPRHSEISQPLTHIIPVTQKCRVVWVTNEFIV